MTVNLVVILAVALAGIGFVLLASSLVRHRPLATGPSGVRVSSTATRPPPPAPMVAASVPDSPQVQLNRRMFLNRAWLLATTVFGVAFGGASLGFLWPNRITGFGSVINAGRKQDILAFLVSEKRPYYNAEGRFYLVTYPRASDPQNIYASQGLVRDGLMALYQKCAHLGCRVPFCDSSQWFECPCHGSQYNGAGEIRAGPAPAGLWRFPITLDGDTVLVDTSKPTGQPPKGTDTLREPPAGPHCV